MPACAGERSACRRISLFASAIASRTRCAGVPIGRSSRCVMTSTAIAAATSGGMTADAIDDEKDAAVDVDIVSIFVAGAHATAIARGGGVDATGAARERGPCQS